MERQSEDDGLYPVPSPKDVDWSRTLTRLAPLVHERGERWPLVAWEGIGFEPQQRGRIKALLRRGFVQHLRLRHADIAAAVALERAGAPIILMEGIAGAWPYDTVDEKEWRLQFPSGADIHPDWRGLPDPTFAGGWERARRNILEQLKAYKSAGVNVDAVWLDYEGALLHDDYQALRASHAAGRIPASIVDNEARYRNYRRVHWLHGLSRYMAAPVRQVYPDAAVTNWVVMLSTFDNPILSWDDWRHPPSPTLFFTHTNPIAYGVDTYFHTAWPQDHEISRQNVDRFYTHLLLRQVSTDALNREKLRPDLGSVAWVARWVPDNREKPAPVMSRAAYREALRHIWLRGIDGMQVFNPTRNGYEQYAVQEIEDVQRIYDEMLAYRKYLENGKVMNFNVPNNRDALIMWSGLQLEKRALVRITNLGARQKRAYLCFTVTWCVDLSVPEHGHTYILKVPEPGR